MTKREQWDQQVATWKAYGITPDLVRRFRAAGVPDYEMHHWIELKQACGYTEDDILDAATQLMRMRERRIRGW